MALTIQAGEPFAVRLNATATTGYLWEVWRQPADLAFLGGDVEAPPTGSRPGEGNIQVFRFGAAQTGEFEIEFRLKRPWEKFAIESQTVKINTV